MKFVFIIMFLVTMSLTGSAQCEYRWHRYGKISDDTITQNGQFFREERRKVNIDFDALIKMIKIPRFPEQSIKAFRAKIDDLRTIDTDSAKAEIDMLEYSLESKFQILELDSIEYALYDVDTVIVKNHTIPLYRFTTSFYKEWNEDHNNDIFYYASRYGVIYYEFYPLEEFVCYTLANSCNFSSQDIEVVKYLIDYIEKSPF